MARKPKDDKAALRRFAHMAVLIDEPIVEEVEESKRNPKLSAPRGGGRPAPASHRLTAEALARWAAEAEISGSAEFVEKRLAAIRREEEEEQRKLDLEVRLAVEAILEEDATSLRRALIERVRPKLTEADAQAKAQAKAAEIKRLAPIVKAANVLAGGKLSITDPCVDRIRPHLPKEEQHATCEMLKDAIREAKGRYPRSQRPRLRPKIEMPL